MVLWLRCGAVAAVWCCGKQLLVFVIVRVGFLTWEICVLVIIDKTAVESGVARRHGEIER